MVYSIIYTGSLDGSISQDIRQIGHLGTTEVLVRVTAAALCHRDSDFQYEETTLGHEGAGVVDELGGDVWNLTVGDRVVWSYQQDYCGVCAGQTRRAIADSLAQRGKGLATGPWQLMSSFSSNCCTRSRNS